MVNSVSSIKFDITTTDLVSISDYITITLPSSVSLSTFNSAAVSTTFGIDSTKTSYAYPTISVYFPTTTGISQLPAGSNIFITVPNFVAPPSTQNTADFTLNYLSSSGYPKMTSTQTITAVAGTLSGTVAPTNAAISQVTTYTFSVTIPNPLTSSGSIKIAFPSQLSVANNPSCAVLTGTSMALGPTCTYSALDNSMTFSAINSSSSNIPAQTFTLAVSGITNPPSTSTTGSFSLTTFYDSTNVQVDTGSISGVTSTPGTIDHTKAAVSSSSVVNSDSPVTYSLSFVVSNPIPAGGYIIAHFPTSVVFDTTAANSGCQIAINTSTASSTTCSASLGSSYVFNFTNPLSTEAVAGTTITLSIAGAATNPPSTQPFSPFSLFTYHSDGSIIASMVNALQYATTTASAFTFNQFSRLSDTNAALTTYSLNLIQIA